MDATAIGTVAAAVVVLTQLVKWSGLPDKLGPVAVLVLAAVGVAAWAWSTGGVPRDQSFQYFVGWLTVATSAAGVYGFTRAAPDAVTALRSPPPGAAQSPTEKIDGGGANPAASQR